MLRGFTLSLQNTWDNQLKGGVGLFHFQVPSSGCSAPRRPEISRQKGVADEAMTAKKQRKKGSGSQQILPSVVSPRDPALMGSTSQESHPFPIAPRAETQSIYRLLRGIHDPVNSKYHTTCVLFHYSHPESLST